MAKVGTMLDQNNMPVNGKWIWKEETSTLEYISNTPNADRQAAKRGKGHNKAGVHFPGDGKRDRNTPMGGKYGGGRGRSGRTMPGQRAQSSKQSEHSNVQLSDIKDLAYNMLNEVAEIADTFDRLIDADQFDDFLLCLFNYFHWFFEKKALDTKPNPMNIEPSKRELQHYAEMCQNVESAGKILGKAYCILVLGIGLPTQHHMACGQSRVSNTYQDRSMYETLYQYCTFTVWIAFRRKEDFDTVKRELCRMLRSDTFNPAIRVKNAPEPDILDEDGNVDTSKPKKEEVKLTPAEYRRVQGKRPPIKSIINQRSPALVSILPSPKEESGYLFKRMGESASAEETQEEDMFGALMVDKSKLKKGIVGEPMCNFTAKTLIPIGAETEEGEEEENESKHSQRRESTHVSTKTPQSNSKPADAGVSREQTAISTATEEGLPDD